MRTPETSQAETRPGKAGVMSEHNGHFGFIPLMPDGTPVPSVMLEPDLIRFLRLNELGVRNPENTLRYYRERGKLRATKIGNRNCYTVQAALDFLEEMTKKI
jgi:hypothetical protein